MRLPNGNSHIIKYADNTVITGLVENNCKRWCFGATEYTIQWWKANYFGWNITETKEMIHYLRKTPAIKTPAIVDYIP